MFWLDTFECFWRHVDVAEDSDCWLWRGSRVPAGYGQFQVGIAAIEGIEYTRYHMGAHRYAYALAHGDLPARGLEIDHLCRTKSCVNPDHLEAVTHQVNVQRSKDRN